MLDPTCLGDKIKLYRKKSGLTQAELAQKLNVSFQAVSSWETGSALPDIENLCKLSLVFNQAVDELLRKQSADGITYMIGIDGGGTSTEFALFSSYGHVFKRVKLKGSNSSTLGIEGALNILYEGIELCLEEGLKVSHIFVGIAGGNYEALTIGLKQRYPLIDICVDSDGINALFSAVGDVALILGTGTLLLKKTENGFKTFGGWGYLYGDPGSAFSFGKEAVRVALLQKDGGKTSSLIASLINERLDILASFMLGAEKNIANVAGQASIIFEAYNAGDKVALSIINGQMKELKTLVELACPKGSKVIACGGIMEHFGDILIPILKKHVREDISFIKPTLPPIYGACRACFDIFKLTEGEGFYDNFYSTYKALAK